LCEVAVADFNVNFLSKKKSDFNLNLLGESQQPSGSIHVQRSPEYLFLYMLTSKTTTTAKIMETS
jgi:hypothetical protein